MAGLRLPVLRATFALPLVGVMAMCAPTRPSDRPALAGFASLTPDTFSPGPTSGQFITAANGVTPPFLNRQPVQGFSAVVRAANGDLLVMIDNGFGSKLNSPDSVLRVYRITPDFKTRAGGTATVAVVSHIQIRDPDRRIGFPIVADGEVYPGTPSGIPVDASIKRERLLTGGDVDIESMREAPDGTFWFGDEFGPFLIHTDASGKLLDPPFSLPGVRSPQNPLGGTSNLAASRGFEGMALPANGTRLYPMLEGPVAGDDTRHLIINEFDLQSRTFTNQKWIYRLDLAGYSIGDLAAVTDRTFLVLERDDAQGDAAKFKRIFLVNLDERDAAGILAKHLVVDLLDLADPDRLGGTLPTFRFPFQTIESILPLGDTEILVLNDNNYPFSAARMSGRPDPNEIIIIRLDRPLTSFLDKAQRLRAQRLGGLE